MAGAVRRIHESIDRFAAIEGMADLLAFRKEFQLSWSGKFNRLVGAFWTDARKANDTAGQTALRHAFRVLRDTYVAVYIIRTGVSQSLEQWSTQIEEFPLLRDPNFAWSDTLKARCGLISTANSRFDVLWVCETRWGLVCVCQSKRDWW